MRLVSYSSNYEIEWNAGECVLFRIEDPSLFREVVEDLYKQCAGVPGELVFSEDGKELSMSKTVEVIHSPYFLDFNSRKIVTRIYSEMQEIIQTEMVQQYQEMQSVLAQIIEAVSEKVSYPISYDAIIVPETLLKLAQVKLDIEYATIAEKLESYVKICSQLFSTKCVICVQMFAYLTDEEIEILRKTASYYHVSFVFVEGFCENQRAKMDRNMVIDKDKCVIIY